MKKGSKHTDATKAKIKAGVAGRAPSNKGKKFSEEARRNMSKSQMGNTSKAGTRSSDVGRLYPDGYGKVRGSYMNALIGFKKSSAKSRGLEWTLTQLEAASLVAGTCHYCGTLSALPDHTNGIDRVDNSQGYHTSNVVSCCKYCNNAKLDRTVEEFEAWILQFTHIRETRNIYNDN